MKKDFAKKLILSGMSLLMAFVLLFTSINIALAYFAKLTSPAQAPMQLNVNQLFGRLNSSQNPQGDWGTSSNPYLICDNKHLQNLYTLQNFKSDSSVIDETRVFQVSDEFGNPCVVGEDLSIPSIGSEDFPFVSTLRGVTSETAPTTLPTGESTNTSAIYGVTIEAYEGQIDIGLFGHVGSETGGYLGTIENLLLADISISTNTVGSAKQEHSDYHTVSAHETNHIGILAGHAQSCTIKNISVYYSSRTAASAFDIDAGSTAKYTTAGGIIGYYHDLIISEDSPPVNSDAQGEGGINVGTGLGIMFSGDIWDILESSYPNITGTSYDIQETFDDVLYGDNEKENYFQIGVFTFVHSNQYNRNDKLIKLWENESDKDFLVSNDGSYSTNGTMDFAAQKYRCYRITQSNYATYSSYNNAYRFMIVTNEATTNYALMKSSRNAVTQKIDIYTESGATYVNFAMNNGVSSLYDYTFQVCRTRTETDFLDPDKFVIYTYSTANNSDGRLPNVTTSITGGTNVYFCYGSTDIRPLRIYDTISFANSSSASGYPEYTKVVTTSTSTYSTFRLHRGTSTSSVYNRWLHYTASAGFTPLQTTSTTSSYQFQIYAVDTSASSQIDSRLLYSPSDSNYTSYDMSENVLFYEGTPSSSTASQKYRYSLGSIEDLGWIKDDGTILSSVDTSLVMGDSTMYYYTNNTYFGTEKVPVGDATDQTAPRGSVAFRVQTSPGVSTANINIIVATDPTQLINQTINCSYFNPGTTFASSFVLPPVPGSSAADTTSIQVRDADEDSYRTAYPNFNTLLVAYTMTVSTGRTYFLEASSGSVSFVYFSVASTASRDRNYKHKTDLALNSLSGIDFVYKSGTSVATVLSSQYLHSLVLPYFGMKNNTTNGGTLINPIINILSAYDLTYNIFRCNVVEEGPQIYIDVVSTQGTTTKQIMTALNINFAATSYLDLEQRQRVYSDEVIIYLNGTLLDWTAYYSS